MKVSPLPRRGIALEGRDRVGRVLRVSWHAETGRTVVSIWQENTCQATVRLSAADVAELIGALASGLAEAIERKEPRSNVG
ncbi:MAG: hypothetical protein ACYC1E_04775 [Propionibacteriaceae bacterium]